MSSVFASIANLFRAKPLDVEKFTSRMVAEYGKRGFKAVIKGQLHLEILRNGKEPLTAYLDNAWNYYRQDPKLLPELVEHYVASLSSLVDPPAPQAANIVPAIRSRHFLDQMLGLQAEKGHQHHYDSLAEGLVVFYVHDDPSGMRFLPKIELLELVGDQDLRALSLANLSRILPQPEIVTTDGIYFVSCGGDYESSLILQESFWDLPVFEFAGNPVFAVPARDVLLVTSTGHAGSVANLRSYAEKVFADSSYSISPLLYVKTARGIEVYDG
jgi:uncharacterized protein YtpQ (UPF0354 family)